MIRKGKRKMIDYYKEIAKLLKGAIEQMTEEELMEAIEVPQDSKLGDYAMPCFKLAKVMRKAPHLIAVDVAKALDGNQLFSKVEQVGGYVNMFIEREAFVKDTLNEVLSKGDSYGRSDMGQNKKVIMEFSSPNIAKPFHIGHIRSTVIGNSLYKIFDALGYDVFRINHLGDYGTQFGKMICAYKHWGNKEDVTREPINTLLGYYTKFHVEAESNPELEEEARAIFSRLERGEPEEVELWQWFREESLKEFKRVYDMLNVEFDSYNGESFYSDKMPRFEKELVDKGLLVESQGAQIIDLEDKGLGVALIKKTDGSSLYITRDIAAAVYRKETYDFTKNVYVVATQQALHFQQLFEILHRMGYEECSRGCKHVSFGLVRLEEGTMSTRHGRVVFLEDVLNKAVDKTREIILQKNPDAKNIDDIARKVGVGAVVFNELSNSRIKDYVFSWEHILNFDGETGPYVQYTHARCTSVLRKAGIEGEDFKVDATDIDYSHLVSDSAYELLKLIHSYPNIIEQAGKKYEPSIVTRYIVNVAQSFNKFYHDEHIVVDDENERKAKVAIVKATKETIKSGLALLGVDAPERM